MYTIEKQLKVNNKKFSLFFDLSVDFCSNMDLSKGPFCYGEDDIGFVDIMAAPFMIRAPVLETYKSYKVEELLEGDNQAKYKRWVQAVMNHPAVKPTLIDVDVLVKV